MYKDRNILIKNIYYMLSYAYQTLNRSDDFVSSEDFDNLYNLMSEILYRGIVHQLKRGLHREYVEFSDELLTVRGKINLKNTINNRMNNKSQIVCEYDNLSEDNAYNQIIKTTLRLLLRKDEVSKTHRSQLATVYRYFDGLSDIDIRSISWNRIPYDQNNKSYEMLLNICKYIIREQILSDENKKDKMASFRDNNMARLYEKFILEYYKKHLDFREYTVHDPNIKWAYDEGYEHLLPTMQSDIMITRKCDGKTLIIDAKYYNNPMLYDARYQVYGLRSNNIYQIFAYVKNYAAGCNPDVAGILLYAKAEGEALEEGSTSIDGHEIGVKSLDLNNSFNEIKIQLNSIISSYFTNTDTIVVTDNLW